jgi:hypothetical protein
MKTAGFMFMMAFSVIDEVDSTLVKERAGFYEMLVHIFQTVVLHPSEHLFFNEHHENLKSARTKCLVYCVKDPGFKWPPITLQ